jgi:hypothetical protein
MNMIGELRKKERKNNSPTCPQVKLFRAVMSITHPDAGMTKNQQSIKPNSLNVLSRLFCLGIRRPSKKSTEINSNENTLIDSSKPTTKTASALFI